MAKAHWALLSPVIQLIQQGICSQQLCGWDYEAESTKLQRWAEDEENENWKGKEEVEDEKENKMRMRRRKEKRE